MAATTTPAVRPFGANMPGGDIPLGTRVEIDYQGCQYTGIVQKLPSDDTQGRYAVQCDVDPVGQWTFTAVVRKVQVSEEGHRKLDLDGACTATFPRTLRFVHMSDTHETDGRMHRQIEKSFPFPEGDLDFLLHTGDMTDHGSMEELLSVNKYFGDVKHRFKYGIFAIAGNHDVCPNKGKIDLRKVLTNATVLHHEVAQGLLEACGLKIFGSPWCHWKHGSNPGGKDHLFDLIPEGIDILMTHGPAARIFDTAGYHQTSQGIHCHLWGSADDLNKAIMRARPRVHLFGHLHEQRGVWQRNASGQYVGGVEYEAQPGQKFPTTGPPPVDWPCDLVSCNAMCNHKKHDKTMTQHIAGAPRLIQASRNNESEPWRFEVLQSPNKC